MKYEIVLASGSPRRREILTQIGASFRVQVSECDESVGDLAPDETVLTLSKRKAYAVAKECEGPVVVIGADTVVSVEGRILGKPKNREEAAQMIGMLSGKAHEVYTGVCIVRKEMDGTRSEIRFAECSGVKVLPLSRHQIEEYTDTLEPYDKAGGYAIQGLFAPYIEGIEGDYYNIVGLPVSGIFRRMYENGIDLRSGETVYE